MRDYVKRNFVGKGMCADWAIHGSENHKEQTKTATELAYAEVISYNRKNLERELPNESRQHNKQQNKTKRREEEI